MRLICAEEAEQVRRHRRRTWAAWVQEAWHARPGRLYRHTRGDRSTTASVLLRPDGSCTAEAAEMDALLRQAWAPIFRLYADTPEPDWERFAARFGQYVQRVPMRLADLTAADLRRTLGSQSSKSAAGMDGWRVAELKALPDFLLGQLAALLNAVERGSRTRPHQPHPQGRRG